LRAAERTAVTGCLRRRRGATGEAFCAQSVWFRTGGCPQCCAYGLTFILISQVCVYTGLASAPVGVVYSFGELSIHLGLLMAAPPLLLQTTYAELLQRCAAAAFQDAFPEDGTFVSKTFDGRRYWYFQARSAHGRTQKYVGRETDELLARIARHRQERDDERERRSIVSTMVRSFGLPRPLAEIGNVIGALAAAGVFRLRGVLVGTAAYQTYAAMLASRLPGPLLQTADVDIAQFKNVSVAVEDRTPPMIEVLKTVDGTFRAVPHQMDSRRVGGYVAKGGLRVDFLTPNRGADTDKPQALRAFHTDAQPLRFLDYLIHEPEAAVVLHGAGIYVLVPSPERFAIHKLIVSRRRRAGEAKSDKDIQQSDALLRLLVEKRPHELKAAWQEAHARGPSWRQLLFEGMSRLSASVRDVTLKVIEQPRSLIPDLELTFNNPPARYDLARDIVTFDGAAMGSRVQCAVSRAALDDHFGAEAFKGKAKIEAFLRNRSAIERLVRAKFVAWPVEEPEAVLIKTGDVPKLRKVLLARA